MYREIDVGMTYTCHFLLHVHIMSSIVNTVWKAHMKFKE